MGDMNINHMADGMALGNRNSDFISCVSTGSQTSIDRIFESNTSPVGTKIRHYTGQCERSYTPPPHSLQQMANTEDNQITKGSIQRIGADNPMSRMQQSRYQGHNKYRYTYCSDACRRSSTNHNYCGGYENTYDDGYHNSSQPTVNTDIGILSNVAMDQDTTTMTTN